MLLVWDKYITAEKCKYFVASQEFDHKMKEDVMDIDSNKQDEMIVDINVGKANYIENNVLINLCRVDQITPEKEAGLLLTEKNNLYKNNFNKSVSICSSVDNSTAKAFNAINSNLEVAINQMLLWNKMQEDDKKIQEHIIVFPYHITIGHWALGTLELDLGDHKLKKAVVKIYNPLPDWGGRKISDTAETNIQQLLDKKFSQPNLKLSSIETDKIKQQSDGSSCGVISAENGKTFISGDSIDEKLKVVYPRGTEDLRTKHLIEVGRVDFFEAQKNDRRYYDPVYQKPKNYKKLQENFEKIMINLPEEKGEQMWNLIIAMDAQDPILIIALKNFIQNNANDFSSILELFDTTKKDGFEFKADHFNTLQNFVIDLKKIFQKNIRMDFLVVVPSKMMIQTIIKKQREILNWQRNISLKNNCVKALNII